MRIPERADPGAVRGELWRDGMRAKPIIMGEFGAFRLVSFVGWCRAALQDWQVASCSMLGWLVLWTGMRRAGGAVEFLSEDDTINHALAR